MGQEVGELKGGSFEHDAHHQHPAFGKVHDGWGSRKRCCDGGDGGDGGARLTFFTRLVNELV